ncbi:hypothetical protein HIM_10826 [Hirsutella minnesotensis 3608]|uniref:Uncharacterized protein n=1 Tax=Hirsutella minnesotensis 3608 TaxID=1043627 RepID=A0A0F7ZWY6_9HYPO|nr:hypothetical protein HIM_10826 [Hirsutella minnesotensis 3608]
MPRPRLTDEERASRARERKRAQREQARLNRLTEASGTSNVRILDSGSRKVTQPSAASTALDADEVAAAIHVTAATLEPAVVKTDGRYNLRSRSSQSPVATSEPWDDSAGATPTVHKTPIAPTHALAIRPRDASTVEWLGAAVGTARETAYTEPAGDTEVTGDRHGTTESRVRRHRERSRALRRLEHVAGAAASDQTRVLSVPRTAARSGSESGGGVPAALTTFSDDPVGAGEVDSESGGRFEADGDLGDEWVLDSNAAGSPSSGLSRVSTPEAVDRRVTEASPGIRRSPSIAASQATPQGREHREEESPLNTAVGLVASRETAAGLGFIETQSRAYLEIFQHAFPLSCPCDKHPASAPNVSSERFFSARELSAWLRQEHALGDLEPILAPTQCSADASDDGSHHHPQHWKRFLSGAPRALSLHRTERTLPRHGITVTRTWDVDSLWLGATSLGAVGLNSTFHLSLIPPFKQSICGDQVIQPHGIDLGRTRHVFLGSFSLNSLSMSVFVFFPKTYGAKSSKARDEVRARPLVLSIDRQREFVDGAVLPAIRATIPSIYRQEVPPTHAIAYAKQMSYQEKPGTGRWRSEDERRAAHLRYAISGRFLESFWAELRQRCAALRVQPSDPARDPVAYFESPQLLFQAHDTKNILTGGSLADTLDVLCNVVLGGLRLHHLDLRSCWLDIGFRDMPNAYQSPAGQDIPLTLLWKRECHDHYDRVIKEASPEIGLKPERFRTYSLRDVATYTTKAHSRGRAPNATDPGNPDCTKSGVLRAKAYNCSKELFSVMFSDYQTFGSQHLAALALPDEMISHLFAAGHNTSGAVSGAPSREKIQRAWDANKRHLHAVSSNTKVAHCYAVRKEITFRLDVILCMHDRGAFSGPSAATSIQSFSVSIDPAYHADRHYPFWILPTSEVTCLMATLACRFVKPLNHLFAIPPLLASQGAEGRAVVNYYTAKLFTRLLLLSLTSERDYSFDKWIWEKTWTVRKREEGRQVLYHRVGLGLKSLMQSKGTIWLGDDQMDWIYGHLSVCLLQKVYIPRSPGHAKWTADAAIRGFSRCVVGSAFVVRALLRRARRCREMGRAEPALRLERCAARVAGQEIARSYQLHLLEKLQHYWRSSVVRAHTQPQTLRKAYPSGPDTLVSLLDALKHTDEGTTITAWDIHTIIQDGLDLFEPRPGEAAAMLTSLGPQPRRLPVWMSQRGRRDGVRSTASWSEKVFQILFQAIEGKTWARAKFLRDYDVLARTFDETKAQDCSPFEDWLKRTIGAFILVTFNSERTKEVTVSRKLTPLPAFFKIQFWAPIYNFGGEYPGQPLDLNGGCLERQLFRRLASIYYGQRSRLDDLARLGREVPTVARLRSMLTDGGDIDVVRVYRLLQSTIGTLALLFEATNDWPNRLSSEGLGPEEPWWYRDSTISRLLVPIEDQARSHPVIPMLLYPTRDNFEWLILVAQRLCAFGPQVEASLPHGTCRIDAVEWKAAVRTVKQLALRGRELVDQSKALFLTPLLERDLAYEFLTRNQRGFGEQERLMTAFLMRVDAPQERQLVNDTAAEDEELDGADGSETESEGLAS